MQWQRGNGYDPLQLPEPFSGEKSEFGIYFMGLNPSVSCNEVIPCEKYEFEQYDAYYRNRFSEENRDNRNRLLVRYNNGASQICTLWNKIEKFCLDYISSNIGGDFRLGSQALLVEAVMYKTKNGYLGGKNQKQKAMEHCKKFLLDLLCLQGVKTVVPMGVLAWQQLRSTLRFVNDRCIPNEYSGCLGKTFFADNVRDGNNLRVIPIKHLSWAVSNDLKGVVGKLIADSIKSDGFPNNR